MRRLYAFRTDDMKYRITGMKQVIGDDPPVAAPPDGLRAHDRAALIACKRPQPRKALAKRVAHRVIGEVMKAGVLPEGVDDWRNIVAAPPKAA